MAVPEKGLVGYGAWYYLLTLSFYFLLFTVPFIGVIKLKTVMRCSSANFAKQERIKPFFLWQWWAADIKILQTLFSLQWSDSLFHCQVISLDCEGSCDIGSSSCSFRPPTISSSSQFLNYACSVMSWKLIGGPWFMLILSTVLLALHSLH